MTEIKLQKPNQRQKLFLEATERFIAYGGARGGGKSWAVRQKAALMALHYPNIRMMILRRSYPELRENHILPLRSLLGGAADYKDGEKAFCFRNGSRLRFGYCDSEDDVLRYQGQEYDILFLDEATQFTEFQFKTLSACLRGANEMPKRMYLTCNPGGVGHGWVRRLFIDHCYRDGESGEDYRFIPAKVYDNGVLMKKDPGYVKMLEGLPPDLKRAWLEGDWDIFAGQFFSEFRRELHTCEPFCLPQHWRRYFTMDYGLDMLAGYFIAVDESGNAYVYREIYESGLVISQAAEKILRCGETVYQSFAPPDLWNRRQDTGRSVAEIFMEKGIYLTKAQNERIAGWMDLKEWLHTQPGQAPALKIFRNCPNLIRTLPQLRFSDDGSGDAATQPHELTHAPDAIRYFIAGRPLPTALRKKPVKEEFHFEKRKKAEKI